MPRKRLAEMSRSERIRYKEREQQRERRYRRKMAMADTDYKDYREGLKLQRLLEQIW